MTSRGCAAHATRTRFVGYHGAMRGLVAAAFGAVLAMIASPVSAEGTAIELESRFMELTIEPDYGARASRIHAREHDYDFVVNWSPDDDEPVSRGGGFAGIMLGTFTSGRDSEGQLNQSYEVLEQTQRSLQLRWRQGAEMFSDLVEHRTITLSDERPEAVLEVEIVNEADEPRVFAYRFQDWTGTGRTGGYESVYINPQDREQPHAYMWPLDHPPAGHKFYLRPEGNWFARADLPRDTGLVVDVDEADVTAFLQYFSRRQQSELRTAEIYFPITRLSPGESWRATVTYRVFEPSDPAATLDDAQARFLSEDRIRSLLDASAHQRVRAGLPLNARMRTTPTDAPLILWPAHPSDANLGTERVQDYGGTLRGVELTGTPGEVVPLAFNAVSTRAVEDARLSLSDLSHDDEAATIEADRFDPRFVSTDGFGYLLNDWELSRDVPEAIAQINNDVRDAEALTPFSLEAGDVAPLWATLRIPDDAAAGTYRGEARIETADGDRIAFDIDLRVHPFTLERPDDKAYGSFFRYRLQTGDEPEPFHVTRPVLREALEDMDEMGYNALVIYLQDDDAVWLMDQCVELGWEHATFVLIGAHGLDPEELEQRYADQDFTILGWTIDEPRYKHRGDIERAVQRYERRMRQGLPPTYTPNSPFALLLAELLDAYVPILVTSVPHFIEVTREYRERGRDIYWYSAGLSDPDNAARVQARLVRGIYLWKEPVNGIIDWGEDAQHSRKSYSSVTGFAGTQIVHRTGRENVRQALLDMRYLHTLERALDETDDAALRAEGEALLEGLRARFADSPSHEATLAHKLTHLDALRGEVEQMITRLERAD